ncbi:murein hydrolase activator NlpD precursor [bacterium BMS3Abin01]|nr:murein hydrolase activator NlpD precursor [bacterium BMS3Abin01]
MRQRSLVPEIILFFLSLFFSIPGPAAAAQPPLPPSGGLEWPAAGDIATGWSLSPATDRGHRGIDIDTAPGSPVTAAAAGVVAFAGYTPAEGGGLTIAIEHQGGLRSTYLQLDTTVVATGQTVSRGEMLGRAGDKPLHFGLKYLPPHRRSRIYLNPMDYLPVREAPASTTGAEGAAPEHTGMPLAPESPDTFPGPPPAAVPALPAGGTGVTVEPPAAVAPRLPREPLGQPVTAAEDGAAESGSQPVAATGGRSSHDVTTGGAGARIRAMTETVSGVAGALDAAVTGFTLRPAIRPAEAAGEKRVSPFPWPVSLPAGTALLLLLYTRRRPLPPTTPYLCLHP